MSATFTLATNSYTPLFPRRFEQKMAEANKEKEKRTTQFIENRTASRPRTVMRPKPSSMPPATATTSATATMMTGFRDSAIRNGGGQAGYRPANGHHR